MERRNELERDIKSFKIGLLLKKAREEKQLTQSELAESIDKSGNTFQELKTMEVI